MYFQFLFLLHLLNKLSLSIFLYMFIFFRSWLFTQQFQYCISLNLECQRTAHKVSTHGVPTNRLSTHKLPTNRLSKYRLSVCRMSTHRVNAQNVNIQTVKTQSDKHIQTVNSYIRNSGICSSIKHLHSQGGQVRRAP